MKIRALLFICCTTILVSAVEAKIKEDEGAPKQIVHIEKMDKRVSELMADRVNIRKNMELKELATLSEIEMEEKENLMFPADELYGSNWENRWVDPFRGAAKVNFPDSFAIDCSSFVYPIAIDSMARITSKYGPRRRRMHKGIDLKVLKGDTIRAAFNGKVRFELEFSADAVQADVEKAVLSHELAQKWLDGKTPKKVVFVPKKMINVVL